MQRKTIHIIDDDAPLASIYRTILEGEGYQVSVSSTAETALEWLGTTPAPDLVLLDNSLPKMSGEEFLDELEKRLPTVFRDTLIIGFTSFRKDTPFLERFRSRLKGLAEKPSDLDEFLHLVRGYLEPKTVSHEKRSHEPAH